MGYADGLQKRHFLQEGKPFFNNQGITGKGLGIKTGLTEEVESEILNYTLEMFDIATQKGVIHIYTDVSQTPSTMGWVGGIVVVGASIGGVRDFSFVGEEDVSTQTAELLTMQKAVDLCFINQWLNYRVIIHSDVNMYDYLYGEGRNADLAQKLNALYPLLELRYVKPHQTESEVFYRTAHTLANVHRSNQLMYQV